MGSRRTQEECTRTFGRGETKGQRRRARLTVGRLRDGRPNENSESPSLQSLECDSVAVGQRFVRARESRDRWQCAGVIS